MEEWRRPWILGTEVVADWCQHCDESVAPIRQRKNTEFVEDVLSVGDGGEKPVEVRFVNALGEESESSIVAARLSL